MTTRHRETATAPKSTIGVGSDERTHLTDFVVKELGRRFRVRLFGPLAKGKQEWADMSRALAEAVAEGRCKEGVLFCWTGTGSCMAANKVPGIRAALCVDAETARGARQWNHANVLVMSLRLTSEATAKEILDTWYSTPYGEDAFDVRNVRKVTALEEKYSRPAGRRDRTA